LMARDRSEDDVMRLKHEFLSMMLGVRRPGVSVTLAAFKKAGLISYSHGKIEILNRAGLEAAACECYGDVRNLHDQFLS